MSFHSVKKKKNPSKTIKQTNKKNKSDISVRAKPDMTEHWTFENSFQRKIQGLWFYLCKRVQYLFLNRHKKRQRYRLRWFFFTAATEST